MAKRRLIVGFTRLEENEFKRGIAAAMGREPDLCLRLRLAIKVAAARGGVAREVRDQYLQWIAEVEAATTVMANAENGLSSGIVPVGLPQTTATAG